LIFIQLLSEHAEFLCGSYSINWIIQLDVIILIGVAWIEPNNSSGFNKISINYHFEHLLSFIIELLGLLSNSLVFEDLWVSSIGVLASDLPSLEEGVPIDVFNQRLKVVVLVNSRAQEGRLGDLNIVFPVNFHLLRLGFGE
jgi:hypothetical protein